MAVVDIPKRERVARDVTAICDVFVDKSGNVVGAKDPAKLTKVISVGDRVSAEVAAKYGMAEDGTLAKTAPVTAPTASGAKATASVRPQTSEEAKKK